MTEQQELECEKLPSDGPLDETDISLRAYFARMSDERIGQYDPKWSDEELIAWDGNFRDDGVLMLICCERDVDAVDYREVLEKHIAYRRQLSR
ncbi:MAG TPA: hypothetical protein PLN21_02035 [Gemmatales bacterium]|nr:hypothetical protein [Gemmatales bacterium]